MLRKISLGGALASSLLPYTLVAIALFLVVDRVSTAIGLYRLVWHPPLVRPGLFLCLLSGLVIITSPEGALR
jgi:hypothetical protein